MIWPLISNQIYQIQVSIMMLILFFKSIVQLDTYKYPQLNNGIKVKVLWACGIFQKRRKSNINIMSSSNLPSPPQFNGENYLFWAVKMELFLKVARLWKTLRRKSNWLPWWKILMIRQKNKHKLDKVKRTTGLNFSTFSHTQFYLF